MGLEEYHDLLDQVSPKYYRQFRLLYNEMIGYVEREEFDQLSDFSSKIQYQLSRSLQLQKALQYRLNNMLKQRQVVQKQALHQQFRHPKKTLPYDPAFPLKTPIQEPLAPVSDDVQENDLNKDRKIDALLSEMQSFDAHKNQGAISDDVNVPLSDVSQLSSDVPVTGGMNERSGYVPEPSDDSNAESSNDHLSDERLKITKEKDQDIDRSRQAEIESHSAEPQKPESLNPTSKPLSGKDRKERVWDYIDKDQQKGEINDSR